MATLAEINAQLKRIEIKGKPYVQVNQRILGFWELCPIGTELHGAIVTEKLSDDGKRCDFRASIYVGGTLVATGHAFEYRDGGMVNKTSYVENAETSAIGRALGVLGIGATESLASAEEMQNALAHQETQNRGAYRATEPLDENLERARSALWLAEKQYCELRGITDVTSWHKQAIETRGDWSTDAATMERIAAELRDAVGA